jgi:DNA-binding CsgD family transcriptional regulator
MLSHYFTDLSQAQDIPSFKKALLTVGAELGFGLYSAMVAIDRLNSAQSVALLNNTPTPFEEASRDLNDSKRDPLLRRLRTSNIPVEYNQKTYADAGAGDLWEQQAPFGYHNGIAVALHLPGARHFVLGFDRPDRLPSSDRTLMRLRADVQLLTAYAQETAFRLLLTEESEDAKPLLSERQLAVLQWIARGKSAWEIGRILGCSENTVKFHTKNIYQKLQAQNKQDAIASGIRRGFIEFYTLIDK